MDSTITNLPPYTSPASSDVLPIVDVANNQTKKVTFSDLVYKGVSVVVAPTGSSFKVDYPTDGTNDAVQLQAASDAVSAAGGGIVLIRGNITTSVAIIPRTGVTYLGTADTLLKMSIDGFFFDSSLTNAAAISDVVFDNLNFAGSVTSNPTIPTRNRTVTGLGIQTAININGSLDTSSPFPVVTNVVIRNCRFRNINSLPIRIFGVSGRTVCNMSEFTNTLDPGFGWCEDIIFTSNRTKQGYDNGVSMSRGNQKFVIASNIMDNVLGDGVWISGFVNQEGPTNGVVVGNTITNMGKSGIMAIEAPKNLVISGNSIDGGYFRGGVGFVDDVHEVGIYVDGYPSSNASPTDYAKNITVTGNMIRRMARGGIFIGNVKDSTFHGNDFYDIGTTTNSVGSTIASNNVTENFGIMFGYTANARNIKVFDNNTVDTRVTPLCNWGITHTLIGSESPFLIPSGLTNGIIMHNNTMVGCRNTNNLISTELYGQQINRTAVNDVDYAVLNSDRVIAYTAISSGRTVTLPTAVDRVGQVFTIKDEIGSGASHNLTIATTSAQTIDGASTATISSNFGKLTVYSNGTNWLSI